MEGTERMDGWGGGLGVDGGEGGEKKKGEKRPRFLISKMEAEGGKHENRGGEKKIRAQVLIDRLCVCV